MFLGNRPTEKTRLDLKKVKLIDSWNRYEPKCMSDNEGNDSNTEKRELRAFEILEDRANNSNLSASSPTVRQLLERGDHAKCNKEVQTSGIVRSLNFNKMDTSTPQQNPNDPNYSYLDSSQECDPLDLTENAVKETNINNGKRRDRFIKTDQAILTENEKKYLENYTKTSGIVEHLQLDQSFDTEILTKRLEELEIEIEKFRTENTKLVKLQREFESERQRFFKSKDDFIKKLDEEKKREDEKLADERKKLNKEKMVFEKNARELRNKPNRAEREEIKKLKEQVCFFWYTFCLLIKMYTTRRFF